MFKVEEQFQYKNYTGVIVFQDLGFRCGYIGLSQNHPLIHISVDRIDDLIKYPDKCPDINFSEPDYRDYPIPTSKDIKWWLGFSCDHSYNGKDFATVMRYFGKEVYENSRKLAGIDVIPDMYVGKHVSTKEEVKDYIKVLIDEIERVINKDDRSNTEMERD